MKNSVSDSEMTALRGVNLGGWLVLERWMTPGVFEGATARDERGLAAELGLEAARQRLEVHRNSFITEDDFRFIKSKGCDFVRLPVGYWLFSDTPGFVDGQDYVDMAFEWAGKHDLGIVLDLHGLPGSQNGKIHSGQINQIDFYRPENIASSLDMVEYLAKRYGSNPALIGLQLINEPLARFCLRQLVQYYEQAYQIADKWLASGVKIIVSDAFKPRRMAYLLKSRVFGERLVMDIHLYQLFGSRFENWSLDQHLQYAKKRQKTLTRLSRHLPIMIGEWSGALPARAHQDQPNADLEFIKVQQKTFDEVVWAHSYWSYKKTGKGAWNWRAVLHEK